jgi:hypothetical protein
MEMNMKTLAYRRVVRILQDARDGNDAEKVVWANKVLGDTDLFNKFLKDYCEEKFGAVKLKKKTG